MRAALAATVVCACVTGACGRGDQTPPVLAVQPADSASAAANGAAVPHGDHNPHFGGVVLMNGDQHFEVVLGRDGSAHLYFSDAMRNELPAATASEATITITRTSQPSEVVPLRIDDSGESWVGRGHPIAGEANVRVAYTSRGKPYFIDVPMPR